MKMPKKIDPRFLAPCGVNCLTCLAHLREKKSCAGCLFDNAQKPKHCLSCARKECAFQRGFQHCFECEKFPCQRIKSLNKTYTQKYQVDLFENSQTAKEIGVEAFLLTEQERWRCPRCGGVICQHTQSCSECGVISENKEVEDG